MPSVCECEPSPTWLERGRSSSFGPVLLERVLPWRGFGMCCDCVMCNVVSPKGGCAPSGQRVLLSHVWQRLSC